MARTSQKNHAVHADQLISAERLFRSGARPPVVSALCGLGKKTAIRIYREIHNASPKQVMLPYDPYWILRSSVNAVHASIFLGAYSDVSRAHRPDRSDAQVFLTAYELYRSVVARNPRPSLAETGVEQQILLDINRAWHLTRQLALGDMALVVCARCRSRHLVIQEMPKPFRQCPVCDVWADKSGRRRWVSVKLSI